MLTDHSAPALPPIATLREQSNKAIAARDFAALEAFYTLNATITPARGSSMPVGAALVRMRQQLEADPTLTYSRQLTHLSVNFGTRTAQETGTWAAKNHRLNTVLSSGTYTASWVQSDGAWLITSEVFSN